MNKLKEKDKANIDRKEQESMWTRIFGLERKEMGSYVLFKFIPFFIRKSSPTAIKYCHRKTHILIILCIKMSNSLLNREWVPFDTVDDKGRIIVFNTKGSVYPPWKIARNEWFRLQEFIQFISAGSISKE